MGLSVRVFAPALVAIGLAMAPCIDSPVTGALPDGSVGSSGSPGFGGFAGTGGTTGAAGAPVACPLAMVACGNGCIPANAVCCDTVTTSYCTNHAGLPNGTCLSQSNQQSCRAPSGAPTEYCCNEANPDFGSNDCSPGQHHCGLLCSSYPCCPGGLGCPGTGTDAGAGGAAGVGGAAGAADAGGAAGAGGSTALPDPCKVAGDWMTDCPAGSTCSGCNNSTDEVTSYYTISPEIAARGGSFVAGNVSYSFDAATCELTASFGVDNACFTGTRTYVRLLSRPSSSHDQTFTCYTNGACTCAGTQTCTDVSLDTSSGGTGGGGRGGSGGSAAAGGAAVGGSTSTDCLLTCLLTNPPNGTLCCLPSGTCGIDYGAGCTAPSGTIQK
jgi:hypothetical protein